MTYHNKARVTCLVHTITPWAKHIEFTFQLFSNQRKHNILAVTVDKLDHLQ